MRVSCNPSAFDEEFIFERPTYPPKGESGPVKVFEKGYFLIPITLLTEGGLPALQPTPAEVVFFLLIMNRFNLNQSKEFFLSDYDAGRTLNTSCKTIQRARNRFKNAGWLKTVEGRIMPGNLPNQSTRYLELNCPDLNVGSLGHIEMKRSTFEFLLEALRGGRIKHRHIMAYLAVRYYEWQQWEENYHDYVESGDFSVPKDTLRGFFGMRDAPNLIKELSQVPPPDGEPLYRCIDNYHSLTIWGLRDCSAKTLEEAYGQKTAH